MHHRFQLTGAALVMLIKSARSTLRTAVNRKMFRTQQVSCRNARSRLDATSSHVTRARRACLHRVQKFSSKMFFMTATTVPNKIGAANSAPRLQFRGFGFFIHLVAGGAALTGAVADLARSAGLTLGVSPLSYGHESQGYP